MEEITTPGSDTIVAPATAPGQAALAVLRLSGPQAIAIAASPLIFDSGEMAIPAIVYALLMNVILLVYLKLLPKYSGETAAD